MRNAEPHVTDCALDVATESGPGAMSFEPCGHVPTIAAGNPRALDTWRPLRRRLRARPRDGFGAASATTSGGTDLVSYGHTMVAGAEANARLTSDSYRNHAVISAPDRSAQTGSPTIRVQDAPASNFCFTNAAIAVQGSAQRGVPLGRICEFDVFGPVSSASRTRAICAGVVTTSSDSDRSSPSVTYGIAPSR